MAQKAKQTQKLKPEPPLLVYSTDPPKIVYCNACRRPQLECTCKPVMPMGPIKPVIRLERKARGGKTVTLIDKLPANDYFLDQLCSFLKRRVGAGGTHYIIDGVGAIELQGDRRDEALGLIEQFRKRIQSSSGS